MAKTFFYEDGGYGEIDFGLRSDELLTGVRNVGGTLYVFTNQRMFRLKPKSRWMLFVEKVRRHLHD